MSTAGPPPSHRPANPESVFTYGAPQLKFGHGAADEIGADLLASAPKDVTGIFRRSMTLW